MPLREQLADLLFLPVPDSCIFPLSMTQPDVALTDFGLAFECLIFAGSLVLKRESAPIFRFWFIIYFLSIGLAAGLGGIVHGFYAEPASTGSRILWPVTLIVLGVASLAATRIGAVTQLDAAAAVAISRAAVVVFFLYCMVILFISNNFLIAIIDYIPVVLFLGWVFMTAYRRTGRCTFMFGFAGIYITLVASGIQQAGLDIHPRYFNHNAVYHVLQAVALVMIFIAARDLTLQMEARQ